VLHSHLLAGATTVIEPHGVLDRRFWTTVDRHGVTSIAGVPHLFEVLARTTRASGHCASRVDACAIPR
jgi:acyl-coenzyme A synthetase/AMP-(fatty) acid ligase